MLCPCSYAAFQLNYVLGDGGRTYLAGYSKSDVKFYWHKMVRRSVCFTGLRGPAESRRRSESNVEPYV